MPKAALPAPAGIVYIIVVCLRSGVSREMLMLMLCTENAFEFIEMEIIKLNDRVASVPQHIKKNIKIFTVL